MEPKNTLNHDRLKTPRAAALAGITFSVLFIISLVLIRSVVPANPQEAGAWLARALHHGLLPVQRDKANEILRTIEAGMTPEQLNLAQRMANAAPGSRLAP